MKNLKKSVSLFSCLALIASMNVLSLSADEEYIYGTMNIPYDEFYSGEGIGYEVDAVSSATTAKWNNPNLTNGTYNSANEDGTGTILGVTYYVALTEQTLAELGDNNYNFERTDEIPSAYKTVSVVDGNVTFEAVTGESSDISVETKISTDTPWGDYVIDVTSINNGNGTSDIGTIYGAVIETEDGSKYAMRHLENIWRDELAWSVGFTTQEPHGNTLNYEDYVSLMGKTISKITYITETGYHNVNTSLYVPVKFDGAVSVADSTSGDGNTAVEISGFPSDYELAFEIEGLEAEITDSEISYKNAVPGMYTLAVNDNSGKYAGYTVSFTLSTSELPVVYDETDKKIEIGRASCRERV